jgi:hypothetical protein
MVTIGPVTPEKAGNLGSMIRFRRKLSCQAGFSHFGKKKTGRSCERPVS